MVNGAEADDGRVRKTLALQLERKDAKNARQCKWIS